MPFCIFTSCLAVQRPIAEHLQEVRFFILIPLSLIFNPKVTGNLISGGVPIPSQATSGFFNQQWLK